MAKKSNANRTPSGAPSAKARKEHGFVDGSYPIFDKKSADDALRLRGHASEAKQKQIIQKAKKYDPTAAKKAEQTDKKK